MLVGETVGVELGFAVNVVHITFVGETAGDAVGVAMGTFDGTMERGALDGENDTVVLLGEAVGEADSATVGELIDAPMNTAEGVAEGEAEVEIVGEACSRV